MTDRKVERVTVYLGHMLEAVWNTIQNDLPQLRRKLMEFPRG